MYAIANNNNLFAVYSNTGLVDEFETKGAAVDFVDSLKQVLKINKIIDQTNAGMFKMYGKSLPEIELEDERVVEEPTTASVKFIKTGKMPSKADLIREQIAIAKTNGISGDIVVLWAVAELNMKKPLAKAYVKDNWDKV